MSQRCPGTVVEKAEQINTRKGAGNKLWFRVGYRDASDLPDTFVLKGGFTQRDPDEFTVAWEAMTRQLNAAEARFYRDFSAGVDLEIPACYYADIDEESGRGAVVLEDLTADGARFGSYDHPLDADGAAAVLEELAKLHAKYWAHPVLHGPLLTDPLAERETGLLHYFITPENWEAQFARPRRERIPAELVDHGRIVQAVRAMWACQFDAPLTALHGDPHIGNLYFRPDGRPGLLDWQVFSRGIWAVDIAYFLVGALDIPTRRSSERDLLAHYLEHLAAAGAPAPSWDAAWTSYRQRLFHGFLNVLTPADAIQTEDYNATMGERFGTAILELDSFGALGL